MTEPEPPWLIADDDLEAFAEAGRAAPVTDRTDRAMRLALDLHHAKECMAEAYQGVGALLHHCGLFGHPDGVRLLDVLAYGKTEHGVDLLPFPREALPSPEDALRAERDEAQADAGKLRQMLREVLAVARRGEGGPVLDEAAALLREFGDEGEAADG